MATDDTATTRPMPVPDEASQPFFDGAAAGHLMIQRCATCSAVLHPGTRVCTECLSEDLQWIEASGHARVFSFGVMHQLYHPGFASELPYIVAAVELDEGIRLNTNIIGPGSNQVQVGDTVSVAFVDAGSGVSLPMFRLQT